MKFEEIKKKFDELMKDPTYSIFIYLGMCLIGLLIIWGILISFGPITISHLKIPSFGELLKKTTTTTKPTITLTDILCSYMFKYNITNTTIGNTTCFKDTNCICITSLS